MTAPRPGCWNLRRPAPDSSYPAQDGWEPWYEGVDGTYRKSTRVPVMVDVKHVFTAGCKFDKSDTSPGCSGCKHAKDAP